MAIFYALLHEHAKVMRIYIYFCCTISVWIVFTALNYVHMLLYYSLIPKCIKLINFLKILQTIFHNNNMKGVCLNSWQMYIHYIIKSHQKCSTGIRTWLSADQSSSSTLTESSFLFDSCLIHRDTVMIE